MSNRRFRSVTGSLLVAMSFVASIALTPGLAHAHGRLFCNQIEGTFTWTRTSSGYAMRLDIPFVSSLPDYCTGGVREDSTSLDPPGPGIDGFWGTLTGTVEHLGRCDDRPPPDYISANTITGLRLDGRIYMYNSRLRRVHAHDLSLFQDFIPPVFPSATPVQGFLRLDGTVPGGFNPFGNTSWSMQTRVNGNCPPAGDPKMKLNLVIWPPF